ncbi:MAG: ribosome biogenesis GTP-binding protein YihA/YsxC [Acutalibacteraceae bacterium]|nr:ribosome biogenesis GTP-binding protein YihA/YsxC [Acutalibacteraceae bacterium]
MRFDKIEFTAAYGTSKQLPPSKEAEIVFSGRSNVGKSSLINKLFNRKNLARVSSVPGKTITVNFFKGDGVYFVDLPGYGYAKRDQGERKRWAELMEGYFHSERNIALVIQLVDMRHSPTEDDMMMLNFLRECKIPFVIALTKCDKLNKTETEKRREALEEELKDYADITRIEFSAVKGTGVEQVKAAVEAAITEV